MSYKIDWTTLGTKFSEASTAIWLDTTPTDLTEVTVSPGQYLLIGSADANNVQTNIGESWMRFYNATTNTDIGQYSYYFIESTQRIINWFPWSFFTVASFTEPTLIKLQGKKDSGSLLLSRAKIAAIRVG